ncbi:MAG: acyl carrier protein [Eubacterium sp.]|jgi:Acyl carrier protein|nr:acyl carrier protein [Eubacterium sp.]
MEEKVLSILKEIRPEFDFEESDNFVEDGYLDSFDIVTLVSELETAFDVVIDGLDVLPENFETVQDICNMVNKSREEV